LDVKKLNGKWRVEHCYLRLTDTGKPEDAASVARITLVIGETLSLKWEGVAFGDYDIKYNLSKTPVWIDLQQKSGPAPGATLKGVLDLKGDDLKIHVSGDDRPAGFGNPKGRNAMLLICKRVK